MLYCIEQKNTIYGTRDSQPPLIKVTIMRNHKETPDPEKLLITIDQMNQTLEVMESVLSRLKKDVKRYISETGEPILPAYNKLMH